MRTLRLALVALVVATACRTSGPAPSTGSSASPQPASRASGPTAIPEAIRWVRDSAEHRAIFLQTYRDATAAVEREAAHRADGTWAVVLDADETVLDNSAYALERARAGLPVDGASWHAWIERRAATPLPGAAAFLRRVRSLGGRIAIVTNRTHAECPDTEAVFRADGLDFDVMMCMPESGGSDKSPRFEAVADGTTGAGLPPLRIVAFLGDNIRDFPGQSQAIRDAGDEAFAQFGARFFVFPNPMYGSWR